MNLFLGFLTSKAGIFCILAAVVLGALGAERLQVDYYKSHLVTARADLVTEKATSATLRQSVTASEAHRAAEYATATSALGEAEQACAARVAEAHRQAGAIRTLMEKPHATDPKTGCPLRALLGAGELRDAFTNPAKP